MKLPKRRLKLPLIAFNYTVMLNGYSQWLNIKRKKLFHRDILISVMLAFNHKKMPLKKSKKYTVFVLFVHCTFED